MEAFLQTLADSVTGVTSATVGAVVATVTLTMNFIRTVTPGETIRVTSKSPPRPLYHCHYC